MSMLLVHDDSGLDPVSALLSARPRPDVDVVPLSVFLRRMGVRFDDVGGCLVQAPVEPGILPVAGTRVIARVIDRVSEVSVRAARALVSVGADGSSADGSGDGPAGDDGAPLPTTGQLQQAYEHLVRDLARLPPERQTSTLGWMLPLTSQWFVVRGALPHLSIPTFKSGYGPEPIDESGLERPIWKSPFDFYAWQPNQRPEGPIWDALVVSRPEGSPVLVYGRPDDLVVSALGALGPEASQALDAARQQLTADSARILQLFGFGIGEVLWFVSPQGRVFAACSPLLYGCARQPDFAAVVDRYIDSLAEVIPA